MNKVSKTYRLNEEEIKYIENYRKEKKCKTISDAIAVILEDHRINNQKISSDENGQIVAQKVIDYLMPTLTRIRLGSNTADRNSQIIIEVLNTILEHQNINMPWLTNEIKSEVITAAEQKVKDDIAHYKEIKDNKSKK